eukprot:gene7234-14761_t
MSINPNGSQDWTPVVLSKTPKQRAEGLSSAQAIAQAKVSGAVSTERKFAAGENKSAHVSSSGLKKLEDSTDEFKHSTVDATLSRAIMQARITKKMTQKELATAINEKPQIIQQYEAGSAMPNPQIIVKLERVLGIHLPRGKK